MKKVDNKYLRRIVYSIQFLMSIVLVSTMYFIQFVPIKYLIITAVILIVLMIGEYFLIFYKKKGSKRSLLTQFLSLVLSCFMIVGSFYIYKTGLVVDLLAEEQFQTRAISVIVLKDSIIKNEHQLPDHLLSHVSYVDEATMDYTVAQIEDEVGQITLEDSSDFHQLVTKLYQKDVDAIILDEAFRSLVEQEKEHFAQVNGEVVRRETRAAITMGITNPMMNLLLNTGLTLVVVVGAFRVNAGVTKVGVIIAFLSYFTIILNAMLSITRLFVMYSRGSASAARICEVLYTREDLTVKQAPAVSETEHIVFEDVSFSYQKKGDDISHISFRLKKGETLGIIGGTGSGKSTISALLMRLYERDSGSIRIDGKPVESIPPEELHTKFGVVFQNDILFADTIEANIDFGRNLPHERIVQAAQCAQAMEFIQGLPDGFSHMLTPRGTNLSGGQKQRVLLARALAGYSEILILDDSSSALDYRTDAALRKALRENYGDVTTIVIAQRVSSILHADHILVLEDGKELGYGTHEELMERCPLYREISESQMGGDFT